MRDASRWAQQQHLNFVSAAAVPPFQLPSGSPIDSDLPSSPDSDEDDLLSPVSSDDESIEEDGFPGLSAPLPRRPASPTPSKLSGFSTTSGLLLPNNKNTKSSLPSPALSTGSSNADGYFSGTFLDQVLPRSTAIADAIPVATGADSPWSLVLHETEDARVVYAKGAYEGINLRENLVDLLDLADEELDCDQVVVVLDKSDADLGERNFFHVADNMTSTDGPTHQPQLHSSTRSCMSAVSSSHPPTSPSTVVTLPAMFLSASTFKCLSEPNRANLNFFRNSRLGMDWAGNERGD